MEFPGFRCPGHLDQSKLVRALGGDDLVQQASLQIKGATGHVMSTSGCIFIVISRKDEKTGLFTKTHQQAYISANIDDVVLSREAMESLKMVSNLDDKKKATVRLVSSSSPVAGSLMGKSSSPGGGSVAGGSLRASRIESCRAELERERHRSRCPARGTAGVHSTQVV